MKGLNEEPIPVLRHKSITHNFFQGRTFNGCFAKLVSNLNAKVGLFILSDPGQQKRCVFSFFIFSTSMRLYDSFHNLELAKYIYALGVLQNFDLHNSETM